MNIDVVLITYNQEKYVTKAISSILMQRVNKEIEVRIIVADDCSTDNTIEIIRSYEEISPFPFEYLPTKHNLGVAANYKRAFEATHAEYVAVLEGDDWWCDLDRLQKHINYLSTHTECVLTKNNYIQYNQRDNDWIVQISPFKVLTLKQSLKRYVLANMSCTVFRGDNLRSMDERVYVFGDNQWREATDWYTHIYMLQYGYGYVIDDIMSVYRVDTGDNISKTYRTDDEMLQRGYMCYQQSLSLLGDYYKEECYWRYEEAKQLVKLNRQNRKYQKWANYISPFLVKLCFLEFPKLWCLIKRLVRNCIPNIVYKKCVKK